MRISYIHIISKKHTKHFLAKSADIQPPVETAVPFVISSTSYDMDDNPITSRVSYFSSNNAKCTCSKNQLPFLILPELLLDSILSTLGRNC